MATRDLVDIDSMLASIDAEQPAGTSLRYQPEYDALRQARQSDDDGGPRGHWERKTKEADWDRVVQLGCELIARKSKDLQIAAWVVEALVRRDGFAGLHVGLRLIRQLQDTFWDTYFPTAEDGDLEARLGPFEFLDSVLPALIRSLPLTAGFGPEPYSFLKWEESRATDNIGLKSPSEREALVSEGKITSKQFDDQVAQTPRSFYETLQEDLVRCRDALEELDRSNDVHFAGQAPGLGRIRVAIADCLRTVGPILGAKRPSGAGPVTEAPPAPEPEAPADPDPGPMADDEPQGGEAIQDQTLPAAAPEAPVRAIAGVEDAYERILEAAAYLRHHDPASPVPYLVVRSLRAGGLYGLPAPGDAALAGAPSSQTRQTLRRLAAEGDWAELLEQAEQALARPEGHAWLDPQYYALRALSQLSDVDRSAVTAAAWGFLRMLLADFPGLPVAELSDGTPTAGTEARNWLRTEFAPAGGMRRRESSPRGLGLRARSRRGRRARGSIGAPPQFPPERSEVSPVLPSLTPS